MGAAKNMIHDPCQAQTGISNDDNNNAVEVNHLAFGVDKAILRNLILQQAGSLQKALVELVMNELDAGATEIDVTINPNMTRVLVVGNGRGFTSFDAIKKHFGTFGFAHDTEEEQAMGRRYGRYGLGRGQIFAFGASHWQTNQFSMDVDFQAWDPKAQDLPYTVKTYKKSLHQGCKIDVALYNTMNLWQRNDLESELKRMLRYTPQQIRLNGKVINTLPDDVKWTHQTEHLRFKASTGTGGLVVYNEGVLICTLRHSLFGISGDLTSYGKTFDVNMARNDIQQTTCKLWPTLKPFLAPLGQKKRKSALTDDDREHLLRGFITGQIRYSEFEKARVVPVISGSYMTFDQLFNHAGGLVTMATSAFSNIGTKLHSVKRAAVISPGLVNTLGYDTAEDFIAAMLTAANAEQTSHRAWDYNLSRLEKNLSQFMVLDFAALSADFEQSHALLDLSSLSKLDKCKFKALESLSCGVAHEIARTKVRRLNVGTSQTAAAWTDGRTYIALKKEIVHDAFSRGMGNLLDVIHILVHEYMHDGNSDRDHDHDKDFFLAYHDKTIQNHTVVLQLAQKAFLKYLSERKKAGFEVLQSEVTNMFGYFGETLLKIINGAHQEDEQNADSAGITP